ncbi:MAG TPA: carboxypeptidase-like regulatory domain-containing protein [Vicinamibacterales bacterium]|nr:carboxypeptidase-like regulatory domain-containing protein [Vicinamibacterales bacterium]
MRWRRVLLVSALALCGTADARARQQAPGPRPNPPPATALIMGRVVDGTSERPMTNVIVTLSSGAIAGPVQGGGPPARVITDSNGRFLFRNLPAGRYNFAVGGSAAFFGGGYGMRRPGGATQAFELAEGEKASDVTLRVWKYGSISGTVVDQYGDPLIETKVAAVRVDVVAGRRRYGPAVQALTDDRGVYRISRLVPGDYLVYLPFTEVTLPLALQVASDQARAAGQAASSEFQLLLASSGAPELYGSGFKLGDNILVRTAGAYGASGPLGPVFTTPSPGDDGRLMVYPLQFYPSVTRPIDATLLAVESGQDRSGTDMQTRLAAAVRITGHVAGPSGPVSTIGVRLVPQSVSDATDERAFDAASTISDQNGAFTFLGVPPGAYVLKIGRVPPGKSAGAPTSMAVSAGGGSTVFFAGPTGPAPPPTLPEAPTLFAAVPLAVGDADVSGLDVALQSGARVSGRLAYEGTRDPLTPDELVRLTLSFDPIDGRSGPGMSGYGIFDATGQFKSVGLVSGQYIVRANGNLSGWTLKSVSVGGRDVSDEPLTIGGNDLTGALVTLTDHPSALSGAVRDSAGALEKAASVLVFPIERERWSGATTATRRERLVRVSAQGTYDVPNLPAGEYFVLAVDDAFAANWQDPERLQAFSRLAARVVIADAARRTQDLVTARLR